MVSLRKGLALIEAKEGLELDAYLDTGGVPTIGYGETKNVHLGMHWTAEQAEMDVETRYDYFESQVLSMVTVPLSQNQLGALTSFVYNVGNGAFKSSTLLRKLNAGDPSAVNEFARWNMDNGKVLPGLVTRRAAEAKLFSTLD